MIKIMIADDQELIRESLKIILSTKEEFRVIATVGSGKEVIEAIRREQPDVILMDMRMPDMDGGTLYQVCEGSVSGCEGYCSDNL